MGTSSSFFQESNNIPASVTTEAALLTAAQTAAASAIAASATAVAAAATVLSVTTDGWNANTTINWNAGNVHRITLAGNTTFTFTGGVDGERLILEVTQDGTGSRTASWPATVRYCATLNSITLSTTAGKTDKLGFIFNAALSKYDLVATAYGY